MQDHARVFHDAYIQDHMTGNRLYFTLIPYRIVDDQMWNSQHSMHMGILDRLRLPIRAQQGAELAAAGVPVDSADRIGELAAWLGEFIEYAQAA